MASSSPPSIPTSDRISDLPDSILCHILSFLPTKHAATTSVLSKRWKLLWLSVVALDFDEQTFQGSIHFFIRTFYKCIFWRDITPPIHSFRFKCRNYSLCEQDDVNNFVDFVLQRGIKNFYLDMSKMYKGFQFELPHSILYCRTLEVLKLKNIMMGDISNMVDLHLPNLKTLHLNKVSFVSHEHLVKLLSGCPILEDLKTKNLCNKKNMEIQFYSVKKVKALSNLKKASICDSCIPIGMVCNTTFMRVKLSIWICVMQLTRFDTLSMFQSLTHLEVNFKCIDYQVTSCTWLIGMLEHSPKLQSLTVQDCECLKEKHDKCWKDPPIIPKCLSSQLKTCWLKVFQGTKCGLKFAKYIIENSKVLDTVIINSELSIDKNAKDQMLKKLYSCTRGSTTCKLLFD